ncbi:hypothetical protein AGMMS50229_19210 [Campylobacterota bacterium]|nr:hypothetical protein AGMMS50229_19210 [Campylobacterota bacterium]
MSDRIEVKFAKSSNPDAAAAVSELLEATRTTKKPTAVFFFCSPKYNLQELGAAIKASFDAPTIGCTSAGEILGSVGYMEGTIVLCVIASNELRMSPKLFKNLDEFVREESYRTTRSTAFWKLAENTDEASEQHNPLDSELLNYLDRKNSFSILLVDGLSRLEEQITTLVTNALRDIDLVGASAGDGEDYKHAFVYYDGSFYENAAVLAICETTLPFQAFRIDHFEPTDKRLVITSADSTKRIVYSINDRPAAAEYARLVGVEVGDLTRHICTANPFMLQIGGEHYILSVYQANPDGSLSFFCSIEEGLVCVLAKPTDIVENLRSGLEKVKNTLPNLSFIFGGDCVLRRLELEELRRRGEAEGVLKEYPFIGVSAYGEQFNGLHVNQTLTALAIGG